MYSHLTFSMDSSSGSFTKPARCLSEIALILAWLLVVAVSWEVVLQLRADDRSSALMRRLVVGAGISDEVAVISSVEGSGFRGVVGAKGA
jgi:hypothetical protein